MVLFRGAPIVKKRAQRQPLGLRLARAMVPRGLLVRLRPAYITWEVVNHRARREPAVDALRHLVKTGDFVADLGASIGVYALELSPLVGPTGRVYSFEPITQNFKIVEEVVRRSRLANVRPYHAAIGSAPGHREMVIPNVKGFSGFYTAHFVRAGDEGNTETVEVFRLDDLWDKGEIPRLDFIKADVAGAELEVIEGGKSLLASLRPGLLLGVSRRSGEQAFVALREFGYKAFLYAGRFVETQNYDAAKAYHHFFFHPESSCWRLAESAGLLDVCEPCTKA